MLEEAVFEWWNDFLRFWRVSIKPLLCKASVAGYEQLELTNGTSCKLSKH